MIYYPSNLVNTYLITIHHCSIFCAGDYFGSLESDVEPDSDKDCEKLEVSKPVKEMKRNRATKTSRDATENNESESRESDVEPDSDKECEKLEVSKPVKDMKMNRATKKARDDRENNESEIREENSGDGPFCDGMRPAGGAQFTRKTKKRLMYFDDDDKYDSDEMKCHVKVSVKSKKLKECDSDLKKTGQVTRRRTAGRIKWSSKELKLLRKEFAKCFRLRKAPDEESIKLAVKRHEVLCKRTIPQIKSRTLYLIQTGR